MSIARPAALVLTTALLLAAAWPAAPSRAGVLEKLLEKAAPAPRPVAEGEQPVTKLAFSGFHFHVFSPDDAGQTTHSVGMGIEAEAPGETPPTYRWSASRGELSASTGDSATWMAKTGGTVEPGEVIVTVTATHGTERVVGRVLIRVPNNGETEVTKIEIPGMSSAPEDYMGCLTAAARVRAADGSYKALSDVHVGDRLSAYDSVRHQPTVAVVEQVLVHNEGHYKLSIVKTESGHSLTATANHPLLTVGGDWQKVSQLTPGQVIQVWNTAASRFEPSRVVSIVRDASEVEVVYNLKTSAHNYVAEDVLVHNKCLMAGTPIETPDGPRRVESLRPGQRVYAMIEGRKQITRVTHTYAKTTIARQLPGKRLTERAAVTVNHLVLDGDFFRPAGELNFPDQPISGTVYDLQTAAGNYCCEGFVMTASDAPMMALVSADGSRKASARG